MLAAACSIAHWATGHILYSVEPRGEGAPLAFPPRHWSCEPVSLPSHCSGTSGRPRMQTREKPSRNRPNIARHPSIHPVPRHAFADLVAFNIALFFASYCLKVFWTRGPQFFWCSGLCCITVKRKLKTRKKKPLLCSPSSPFFSTWRLHLTSPPQKQHAMSLDLEKQLTFVSPSKIPAPKWTSPHGCTLYHKEAIPTTYLCTLSGTHTAANIGLSPPVWCLPP